MVGLRKKVHQPPHRPVTNSAPQLALEQTYTAMSGSVISINHTASDADGDPITLTWSNDIDQVEVTQSTLSTTSLRLPVVTSERVIALTLTARDDKNAADSKDVTITIQPKSEQAVFNLLDSYSAQENSYFEITTEISAQDIISDISWELDDALRRDVHVESDIDGTSGSSSLTLLTPEVTTAQTFNAIITVTVNGQIAQKHTQITVNPDTQDFLSISLPESYTLDEGKEGEISVVINSSDSQPEIQWRWKDSDIPLTGDSSKTVSFVAPDVNSDQILDLEVTVNGANQTQVEVVPVTIKDVTVYSNITLEANRTAAVKGHEVYIDVTTENPEQISEIEWTVSNLTEQEYEADEHRLNITVPEVSSDLFLDIVAQATISLTNGTQTTLTQTIRVLNFYTLNYELDIGHDIEGPLSLYKSETGRFELGVANSHDLIDSVAVDLPFTTVAFTKKDAQLVDDKIVLELLSDEIETQSETSLQVIAFVGDYQVKEYIKVRLLPSHYAIYTGVKEQFFIGSKVRLFHQLYYDDSLIEGSVDWQNPRAVGDMITGDDGIPSYQSWTTFYGDVELTASFDKDNTSTQSEKVIQMYLALREGSGDIRCSVSGYTTYCFYDNRTIEFNLDTEQQKQLKLNNNVACMLTQNSEVECIGSSVNPIVTELPQFSDEIERLQIIGDNNACVQFANTSWQCWGNNSTHITSLINKFSHVYSIVEHKQKTCLVADGYLRCFDEVGVAYFNDLTGMIKQIDIKYGGICYLYTHQKTDSWQCPTELK